MRGFAHEASISCAEGMLFLAQKDVYLQEQVTKQSVLS